MSEAPDSYPKILALILPMDSITWYASLGTMTFMLIFFITYLYYTDRVKDISVFLTFVLAITFNNSSDFIFKLTSNGIRIAAFAFVFTMFVLSAGYSASLISFLSIKVYPPPADTFDQVAKLVEVQDRTVR